MAKEQPDPISETQKKIRELKLKNVFNNSAENEAEIKRLQLIIDALYWGAKT